MSDAAKGAARVGSVMTTLAQHGFRCARVSASGQRKGARKSELCLAGDIIALAPNHSGWPHLLCEIGGAGKRLRPAFEELRGSIMPGFAGLVVRFVNRKRWYYTDEDSRADSLSAALEALRAR